MNKSDIIFQASNIYTIPIIDKPTLDPENRKYIIFVRRTRLKNGKSIPTNFAISEFKKYLSIKEIESEIISIEDGESSEDSIKNNLSQNFIDHFRNIIVSIDGKSTTIWVEPKVAFDGKIKTKLDKASKSITERLGLSLKTINEINNSNTPSKTYCLRAIRKISPCSIEDLKIEIEKNSLHVPTMDWLSNRLDQLRKSNMIVRQSNGTYMLTQTALIALGSTRNRRSPDITRMLDLARRGM